MAADVEILFEFRHELAEMPYWDGSRRLLCYVDIDAGSVNELDVATGDRRVVDLGVPLGFALPVAGSRSRLCGQGGDLVVVDELGGELGRFPVEPGIVGNRLNEGKADPHGRLWFGSMSKNRETGEAMLYRFDRRGLERIRPITIGNGTDWDVERRRMYHVDSTTQRVDVFDYDVATGEVEHPRPWVEIDPDDGLPDGLTIDADGCVWLALFRGGAVRRFDPDGVLMSEIRFPTPYVTCPAFGGDDLRTLYVTSSRHRVAPEDRAANPLAGALFAVDAGVAGRPAHPVSAETVGAVTR